MLSKTVTVSRHTAFQHQNFGKVYGGNLTLMLHRSVLVFEESSCLNLFGINLLQRVAGLELLFLDSRGHQCILGQNLKNKKLM